MIQDIIIRRAGLAGRCRRDIILVINPIWRLRDNLVGVGMVSFTLTKSPLVISPS